MPVKTGFDASCDCRPILPQAKAAGVDFICRYYSHNQRKSLSPGEAVAIGEAGIDLVTVWEGAGNDPRAFSATNGNADAWAASQLALACGQPAGSAVYFAVDFDAGPIEMPAITAYFAAIRQSFAAAIGRYRIGVYGSGYVCLSLARIALADLFWLAAGWRDTQGCTGWHIRQHAPPEDPWDFGFLIDRDEAIDHDFGQWRPNQPPAPTPVPELPRLLRLRDVMMRGPDVTELQRLLDQHAAPCDVDGIFGRQTDASLRTFQGRAGLAVDGICGPLTWAALRAAR